MEVSFGANLRLDKSYPKAISKRFGEDELLQLANDYKKFLEEDKVTNALIPNDEFVLSAKSSGGEKSINLDIYEQGKEEPYQTFISISNGSRAKFNLGDLIYQTYYYIAQKSGITQRFSENSFRFIKRGILEYAKQIKLKEQA